MPPHRDQVTLLCQWIARNVPDDAWFDPQRPLFADPRTGAPYHHKGSKNRSGVWWIWRDHCIAELGRYVPVYAGAAVRAWTSFLASTSGPTPSGARMF